MTKSPVALTSANHQTAFGLTILNSSHPSIRALKRQHVAQIHGNKFWKSTLLLIDYFRQHPLPAGAKVLELGAGWGLAGIYLNRFQNAEVTAVDADDQIFPYLHLHAEINQANITTRKQRFEKITKRQLAEFDVIIGADICFWDEMTGLLYNLVNRAIQADVDQIVLADPGRQPFLTLAGQCEERFFASTQPCRLQHPVAATGCLMIIENA